MTDDDIFRSKEEELQRLVREIAEIKASIKEILTAVGRIEHHVKRSFELPAKAEGIKLNAPAKRKGKQTKEEPSISPQQALGIFDELSVLWDRERPQAVEARLEGMSMPDLKLIAHELGVTFSATPSKKSVCSGIIGRLNERAMLSKNMNVTLSQRERMQNGDTQK